MCAKRNCKTCGNEFDAKILEAGRPREYCGKCRTRNGGGKRFTPKRWQGCVLCGKKFFSRKRKFCSAKCRVQSRNRNTIPESRPCVICGGEFKPSGTKHIYCKPCGADRVRKLDRINSGKRGVSDKCRRCGMEFVRRREAKEFCSRTCWRRFRTELVEARSIADAVLWWVGMWTREQKLWRACVHCGGFVRTAAKNPCCNSIGCLKLERESKRVSRMVECVSCGQEFECVGYFTSVCSIACKKRRDKAAKKAAVARREMKKHNNPYGRSEAIDEHAVFCSDLWICGVCGQAVDHRRRNPDPLCAEMDHVVPLSKWGTHTRANVQCTHRFCNQVKTDGTQEEAQRAIRFIQWVTGMTSIKDIVEAEYEAKQRLAAMGLRSMPVHPPAIAIMAF